ncbi:hypothetical protein PGT21_031174 [Puccinia graminis f. sp. tritici]|uniref:Uncharacterized protein n=1 Tax=Puccinia graminis f. sp. tritici TaxID=56615 RepID=A0A5B0PEQ6_PUCGR|nr:hypothetical protein PGT21_029096 [Puccinia graminis f. sp. tritici]KAA1118092.1 hypothetical protein PGT21_031174 [Puccinia graminis f. sp. tritici]KAA1121125.1 hypothetical protein PGTUg99_015936 [Puccinia graminis f. sp. tritici]KAA1128168.1 hypothetical protein PGTUg99_018711 [Puccinia graminis f. sp. tritici]
MRILRCFQSSRLEQAGREVIAVQDNSSTRSSGGDEGYSCEPLPTTGKWNTCRKCHCCGFSGGGSPLCGRDSGW